MSAGNARGSAHRTLGRAWITLTAALAVHVTDEAANGFLAVYNPIVTRLRGKLPFLPLPTFTFTVWLTGLVLGVVLLALITPLVFRGATGTRTASLLLGALMALNGLTHAMGSLYLGRLLPGTLSAPLLLAASIWLVWAARRDAKRSGRRF